MKSIFDSSACQLILERMDKLHPNLPAQWGKMNVPQMLAHCQAPIQVGLGEKKLQQSVVGFLFGRIAKKQLLKDAPFKKNLPTDPSFIIKDERRFDHEKQSLQLLIQRFAITDQARLARMKHPFFGYMTAEEWGRLVWKHLDHHLLQFGV